MRDVAEPEGLGILTTERSEGRRNRSLRAFLWPGLVNIIVICINSIFANEMCVNCRDVVGMS